MNLKEINLFELGIIGVVVFSLISVYLWGRLDALPNYEVISTHYDYHFTVKAFNISLIGAFLNGMLIIWHRPVE